MYLNIFLGLLLVSICVCISSFLSILIASSACSRLEQSVSCGGIYNHMGASNSIWISNRLSACWYSFLTDNRFTKWSLQHSPLVRFVYILAVIFWLDRSIVRRRYTEFITKYTFGPVVQCVGAVGSEWTTIMHISRLPTEPSDFDQFFDRCRETQCRSKTKAHQKTVSNGQSPCSELQLQLTHMRVTLCPFATLFLEFKASTNSLQRK